MLHIPLSLASLGFPPMDKNLHDNVPGVTLVTWETEPAGLPQCCRVGVSPVSFRLYAEYRLQDTDRLGWFYFRWLQLWEGRIQLILPNVDKPNEARISLLPGDQSAASGYKLQQAGCRIPVYNGHIHTVPLDSPSSGHLCK